MYGFMLLKSELTDLFCMICSVLCALFQRSRPAFPEEMSLLHKQSTGIAVTGGGARAYSSAIGYMAALNKLGLLNKVLLYYYINMSCSKLFVSKTT